MRPHSPQTYNEFVIYIFISRAEYQEIMTFKDCPKDNRGKTAKPHAERQTRIAMSSLFLTYT